MSQDVSNVSIGNLVNIEIVLKFIFSDRKFIVGNITKFENPKTRLTNKFFLIFIAWKTSLPIFTHYFTSIVHDS